MTTMTRHCQPHLAGNLLAVVTLFTLCSNLLGEQPAGPALRESCERMLAAQKEYDATHHALTVATVLSRMADEVSRHTAPRALPLLHHPDWEIRHAAATGLRKTLGEADHEALAHSLATETNEYVLSALVGCVSATGTREAAPALCHLVQMPVHDEVRREAVVALRTLHTPEAIPVLLRLLDDTTERVAVEVPYVLGLMKDRRATPKLCAITRDPAAPTRLGAVQALGMIGDPAGAASLRALLTSEDERLAKLAVWSLGRAHDDRTVAALLPLLRQGDEDIAEEARRSLIEIGNDEVLVHFIGRYNKDSDDVLALGVIRSLYAKRDRAVGDLLKELTQVRQAALAEHLSTVLDKRIKPANIKSIRSAYGALFIQVVFEHRGVDVIVVQENDGTFRAGKVILWWIA